MNAPYDAVLSYHLNPMTCGVAKFNHQLAQHLGVPCLPLGSECQYPLVSIKAAELPNGTRIVRHPPYDVLLHDEVKREWTGAGRVFYASEIGCPSTLMGDASRGAYRVLVFGMAHKHALPHFMQLKEDLDRDHPDYTIELSTAVHEGHPWDQALTESTEAMSRIFGSRLRILGFLADDALVRVLQECDAVAAFYVPALRANNTTAWAALAAGKKLYTNRDAYSPNAIPTWESVLANLSSKRDEDSLTVSKNTIGISNR